MKSGLRDRNNLLGRPETHTGTLVSMESGLRDRNNRGEGDGLVGGSVGLNGVRS